MTDKTATLGELISRPAGVEGEAQILDLLREASTEELNAMICGNAMHRLFGVVDDRWLGPDNRTALVSMLARDRRAELGVLSAAGVIYALQRGLPTRGDQEAIRDIVVATSGEDLTRLKNQINDRVDHYDLEGLVFEHLTADDLRGEVLDHIAAEARGVVTGQAKVLIDIDDTTVSSLYDRVYPRGTVYPGAVALYEGLDESALTPPFSVDDLIFVTARPADALGIIHAATARSLRKAGIAESAIVTGPLLGVLSKRGMADGKLTNIRHIRLLFPEYRLIFLGDSGQGDVLVATDLVQEFGDAVAGAFIHDVTDTPDAERAAYAARGIHFYDTFVGCASVAFNLGLITRERLAAVIEVARVRFDAVPFRTETDREAALSLLNRDVEAAG